MFQPTTECVNSLTIDDVTGQAVPESGTGRTECCCCYYYYCCCCYCYLMRCLCAVARVLLNAGADVGSRDNDGWTPLHAAAHWGQTESCEILAQNFASFKAIDSAVCVAWRNPSMYYLCGLGARKCIRPVSQCQSRPNLSHCWCSVLTLYFCFSFLSSWFFIWASLKIHNVMSKSPSPTIPKRPMWLT